MNKMQMLITTLKRWWSWYVKGEYHCEYCPYSWSESGFEECYDAGCLIRGELHDGCKLIPPVRFLLGWPKLKRKEYFEAHRYDGYAEMYEEDFQKKQIIEAKLLELLEPYNIVLKDSSESDEFILPPGVEAVQGPFVVDKESLIDNMALALRDEYEEKAHPKQHKTLGEEWSEVLKRTRQTAFRAFLMYAGKR